MDVSAPRADEVSVGGGRRGRHHGEMKGGLGQALCVRVVFELSPGYKKARNHLRETK